MDVTGTYPRLYGPPGEIRTPDTQVRSLVLYPAELRAEGVQSRDSAPLSQEFLRKTLSTFPTLVDFSHPR